MDDEYKKGWENSLQFRAEWRRLQQSNANNGIPIMLLGGVWLTCMTAMLFTVEHIYHYQHLIWSYGFGIAIMLAGFLIDRRDRRAYKQRYEEFCLKWVDKLPNWSK